MALALQPSPKTFSPRPQAPDRSPQRANQPSRYLHLGPITPGNRDRSRPTVAGMPLAIITGSSRGLGLALARALAERGWALVLDARGGAELERAARELGAITEVVALPGDVADDWHRGALIEAAGEKVDLLVNNASLLGPSPQPPLGRYPLDTLERVYQVNVLA